MIKYIILKYGLLYCKGIQLLCSTQLFRNNSFLMNVFVKVAVVCQLLWPREICLTAFLERNPNTETPDEYDMRAHFASLRVRLSPPTHTHARTFVIVLTPTPSLLYYLSTCLHVSPDYGSHIFILETLLKQVSENLSKVKTFESVVICKNKSLD